MRQHDFEFEYGPAWLEFERFLQLRPRFLQRFRKPLAEDDKPAFSRAEFPDRYKALCHNLALARARGYSDQLIARLNRLVVSGHHRLYGARTNSRQHWVSALLFGFPTTR